MSSPLLVIPVAHGGEWPGEGIEGAATDALAGQPVIFDEAQNRAWSVTVWAHEVTLGGEEDHQQVARSIAATVLETG
jgi:hypothetical protein